MIDSNKVTGYVYLITDGKYYKIGKTTRDVKRRLYELQIGHPNSLMISTVIKTDDPEKLENELHLKFSDKQMQGEWFNLTEEDIREVLQQGNTGEYPKEQYFWLSQEFCESVALEKGMTWGSMKVFFYMIGCLGFENNVYCSQGDIARELNMNLSGVSRAIRFLLSRQIVFGVLNRKNKSYRLNPNYIWKGNLFDKSQMNHLNSESA